MLKNRLFGFVVLSIIVTPTIKAERRNFSVHVTSGIFLNDPMALGWGGGLNYRVNDGFGIGAEYLGMVSRPGNTFSIIPLDFKFYLMDGNFYLGPSAGITMFNITTGTGTSSFVNGSYTTFLIGGALGYEWDFYQNNSINIGIVPELRLSLLSILIPLANASLKLRVSF